LENFHLPKALQKLEEAAKTRKKSRSVARRLRKKEYLLSRVRTKSKETKVPKQHFGAENLFKSWKQGNQEAAPPKTKAEPWILRRKPTRGKGEKAEKRNRKVEAWGTSDPKKREMAPGQTF